MQRFISPTIPEIDNDMKLNTTISLLITVGCWWVASPPAGQIPSGRSMEDRDKKVVSTTYQLLGCGGGEIAGVDPISTALFS